VTGHLAGLPVEEVLPTLMGGLSTWLVLRLTPLGRRLRAPRRDGDAEV
jgi:hypothetical protein